MGDGKKPVVTVIGTGGTISSVGVGSLDLYAYPENGVVLQVDELLAKVPEVNAVAEVRARRFKALPSTAVGPVEWLELAAEIHKLASAPDAPEGIVVTHGTATLEETAYFLHLALKISIPVVLVGAQRPSSGLSTDAWLNIVNAARVAGDPESRGKGVLTVLNDEIQSARDVTKTSTFRLQTFRSPDFGALGHADGDRVVYYRQPLRQHMPDTEFDPVGDGKPLPRVDIALSYAGADGTAIRAYVAAGSKGIVSGGFAPGMSTVAEKEALDEAVEAGCVVVQSSRAGSGRVLPLEKRRPRGCVRADNLTPQKARILLMLALTRTSDPAEIQEMFERY